MPIPTIIWGSNLIDGSHRQCRNNEWNGHIIRYADRDDDYLTSGPVAEDCCCTVALRSSYARHEGRWPGVLDSYVDLFSNGRAVFFHSRHRLPDRLAILFIINALDQRAVDLTNSTLWLEPTQFHDSPGCRPVGLSDALPTLRELWQWVSTDPARLLTMPASGLGPAFDSSFAVLKDLIELCLDLRGLDLLDEVILDELSGGSMTAIPLTAGVVERLEWTPEPGAQGVYERALSLTQYRALLRGLQPWQCDPPVRVDAFRQRLRDQARFEITDFGRRVLLGEASIPREYAASRWVGGLPVSEVGLLRTI